MDWPMVIMGQPARTLKSSSILTLSGKNIQYLIDKSSVAEPEPDPVDTVFLIFFFSETGFGCRRS